MTDVARLRDGSRVEIRPITPDDSELLRDAFADLSERSRYLRFQAPMPNLSERQLSYLSSVDHHDHEALVALDPETGALVGVARYVRVQDGVAEVAVTVADDWQGRGLGTELLDRLVVRAREEDVERFSALVLAENAEVMRLLDRLGDAERRAVGSQVELDIALPETGGSDERIRSLLRGAASGALVPAISAWRLVADFVNRGRAEAAAEPANAVVAHAHVSNGHALAIDAAAALAAARDAHVHLVESYWPLLSDREEAEARLQKATAELQARGLEATPHLCSGDTVDAIIDVAEDERAALIVADPRASSVGLAWRPYSMTDRLCARAPCDVLLVR